MRHLFKPDTESKIEDKQTFKQIEFLKKTMLETVKIIKKMFKTVIQFNINSK